MKCLKPLINKGFFRHPNFTLLEEQYPSSILIINLSLKRLGVSAACEKKGIKGLWKKC
nr:MAG TPA: hypothetical protein [Caudoviricetes sp.]